MQVFGSFGYNCQVGKCDFIAINPEDVSPHKIFYGIGFTIPCSIIFVCYPLLWYHTRKVAARTRRARWERWSDKVMS